MDTMDPTMARSDEWNQLEYLIRSKCIEFVKWTGRMPKVVYLGHLTWELARAFTCAPVHNTDTADGGETLFGMKVLVVCNDDHHVGVG